jgi:ABC-type nitrate/sulfonate/bicarbonate transport system permease component
VTSQCISPVADSPISGYFATASWVQQNPNTLRAFQTALDKGQAYATANPSAVRAILPTYTKITAAEAQKVVLGTFPTTIQTAQLQQLARAVGLAGSGRFLADFAATLEAWAIGLALTVVVAVPLGIVLGSLPGVRYATRAIVEFLRPVPSVALILLVSLVIGPGLRMTVALILSIGAGYITGRVNGPGIGAYIADANSGPGNTPVVLAATFWAGVLGLVLNALLVAVERQTLPWHRASLGLEEAPRSGSGSGWSSASPCTCGSCGRRPTRARSSRRRRQSCPRCTRSASPARRAICTSPPTPPATSSRA